MIYFSHRIHTMCCCLHCPICMYIFYQPTTSIAAVTPHIHALSSILQIGYNMYTRITCVIPRSIILLCQPVHRCNSMHYYYYSTLLQCIRRPYSQLTFFYILFERSEFLIDTSQKKSLRVCPCARVPV